MVPSAAMLSLCDATSKETGHTSIHLVLVNGGVAVLPTGGVHSAGSSSVVHFAMF